MRGTLLVFAFYLFVGLSPAIANQGVFMVVKGDVKVQPKTGALQKAKVGMKVNEGDTIIAGADSRAKVVMIDKNVLQVSPESKIVLEKYVFNEAKDEKNVTLNVIYGKVRSGVQQKYDGEKNTFNVKTPSAVAGVRGTDFVTSFSPVTKATKIVTFEGQVMAGTGFDRTGRIANPVAVNPGQFTVAMQGTPPAPPVEVPKSELANMNSDTQADRSPADAGGGPGGGGGPAGESGNSGGDKSGGGDSASSGPAPASMGVDTKDMTADNGPAPTGAAPALQQFECATCARPATGFPDQLPPELLNGGKTKLIIKVQ